MSRPRALLIALAAICILALVVVTTTLIDTRISSGPEPSQRDAARRDITDTTRPAASTSRDWFAEDTADQRQPPPEPNVTGIVVDETGTPVEGVCVSACHLAPYLATPLNTEGLENRYDFGPRIDPRDDPTEPESDTEVGGFGRADPGEMGFLIDADLGGGVQEVRVGPPWGKCPQCLTDENGWFALRVCDKLWYGLVVEKEGCAGPVRVFREPQEGICLVLYGPGSIVGRVVDADTGDPVMHFTATLTWTSSDAATPTGFGGFDEEDLKEERITVDGTHGEFRFDEVQSRACWLEVEADGYVSVTQMVQPVMGVSMRLVVRLCRSARLTGRVIWASSGDPVPETGVVVKGRRLRASAEYWFGGMSPRGLPDKEGAFSMSQLLAGRVKVSVARLSQSGFGPILAEVPLVERELVLPPGETTDVTLKVADQKASVNGRVVTSEDGGPVENVQVSLDPPFWGFDGTSVEEPGEPMTTKTDGNGAFRFPDVPSADYRLRVLHEQYVVTEGHTLRVKPGESVEGVVIELVRPARVEGRVTDASGRPAKVIVSCCLAESGGVWTDEAGKYSFERVKPGCALLSCRKGYDRDGLVTRFVDIPPGQTVRVDVVLPETYTVSGRTTVAEAMVEDGLYQLLPLPAGTDPSSGFVARDGWKEEGGRFRFDNVPPGKYTLFARFNAYPQGTLAASMPVEVVATDVELELELPTGMITGHVLDRDTGKPVLYAMVSIRREQIFGDPAKGKVDVEIVAPIWTDPYAGSYTFGPLGDGRYAITASKDDYGVGRAEVDVVGGKMIGDADLWLSAGHEVRCTIASAQPDAPVSEVIVTLRDPTQALVTRTYLNAGSDGALSKYEEYVIGCLSPGDYVLEAVSSTTAWQRVELTVTARGKNLVKLRLPAGKTLVTELTDPAGKPVAGAIADIKDALGRDRLWRTGYYERDWGLSIHSASDGHGITRIEHLLPGTYTLTVRAAGYETAEQQVEVLDADETRVKVVLQRLQDE